MVAPYLRIVRDLREAIDAGELADGDLLPSLSELQEQYQVSQSTASKAIRRLVADGYAVGHPGVGVYARRWRPIRRVVPDRFAGGESINRRDTPGRDLQVTAAAERTTPPELVAELLGDDGLALVRRRVFRVDGRPVQLADSWVPLDIAPAALEQPDTGPGGMWARLAEIGHGPVSGWERWRVRPSTEDERATLELPAGARVLDGVRAVRDAGGRVVDVTVMTLDESAYELEFRFDL